ncbi:MAG: caspase family protein [Okeania sp. SIO3I5]|uniref:caspase family protein n=1 Tax=Okeania sp. SIO3I5 TaxID=2607805 RepID=UPI0013B5B719|nr:caspase family protein [Okeania sp. SIO3I5]NEQ36508.1 caspase family protein [Okeania sp. SIO3I5]
MSEKFSHGYALLIGVGESAYPRLSLPVTVKDTQAIYAALVDPKLCGYPEGNIRVLNDKDATRDNILEGLKWLKEQAEADPKATIFIYYSGHGDLNVADNQYYLLPHDIDPRDIPNSALGADSFIEALRKITAEKLLVVIDSCHAAGMATSKDPADILSADKAMLEKLKGLKAVSLEPSLLKKFMESKGRVVLASSRGEQKSWIRSDKKLSIYTHHFLEALHGASNKPGDTEVTVSNLIQHLGKAVPNSAMEQYKQEQIPIADMTNAEDFVIAKLMGGKGLPNKGWSEIQPQATQKINKIADNIEQHGKFIINIDKARNMHIGDVIQK